MSKLLVSLNCGLLLLLPALGLALDNPGRFEARFGLGSATPGSRGQAAVSQLADYLKTHPEVKITLSGHADATGPRDFNVRLSHDRAAAVRDLLVNSYAIDKGRVGIAWLDSSLPVASNATESGRAANRRVVVQFVADGPALVSRRANPGTVPVATRKKVVARPAQTARPAVRRTTARPPAPVKTITGSTLKEVPLSFPSGGTLLSAESLQGLSELASGLKANPDQQVLVQGVPHKSGGRTDLKLARRRVDDVRTRLIYGLNVPAEQIRVKWFGSATQGSSGDDAVGVLLKLIGAK